MQKILDAVSDVLGITADKDTSMENTPQWGSLQTLQIIMALEEIGVAIPLEKIPDIKGAADLLRFSAGNAEGADGAD